MKSKNYYYVGVKTEDGMAFVTEVDYTTHSCYWDADKKPLALSETRADDLALGLSLNGIKAVVAKSPYELTDHFITK